MSFLKFYESPSDTILAPEGYKVGELASSNNLSLIWKVVSVLKPEKADDVVGPLVYVGILGSVHLGILPRTLLLLRQFLEADELRKGLLRIQSLEGVA